MRLKASDEVEGIGVEDETPIREGGDAHIPAINGIGINQGIF